MPKIEVDELERDRVWKVRETPLIVIGWLFLSAAAIHAEGLQLSGGLDGRYTSSGRDRGFELRGLFLNLHKIWADEQGDRWIGVAQADFDHNFEDIKPYQLYLQYKGPLGKWNVRAGHYLLPFGLLATYDTERLLLQGLEGTSLGIRKDTGAEVLGHFGAWDYAISVTDSLSDEYFIDDRANPLFSGRLAYVVENDWQLGLSGFAGRVLPSEEFSTQDSEISKRRLGLDVTKELGPLTLRAEGIGGTDDGRATGGGILLADYAVTGKLSLNTRYADWRGDADQRSAGAGFTYQIAPRLYTRFAYENDFEKSNDSLYQAQVYYEFSTHL